MPRNFRATQEEGSELSLDNWPEPFKLYLFDRKLTAPVVNPRAWEFELHETFHTKPLWNEVDG